MVVDSTKKRISINMWLVQTIEWNPASKQVTFTFENKATCSLVQTFAAYEYLCRLHEQVVGVKLAKGYGIATSGFKNVERSDADREVSA